MLADRVAGVANYPEKAEIRLIQKEAVLRGIAYAMVAQIP